MYEGSKSGSFGEATFPRAFFAPPLIVALLLVGLESVSLDIASDHMVTLRAFFAQQSEN